MKNTRILIIEDDPHISKLVALGLDREGANIFMASDGEEGLRQFYTHRPHLVILDIMLPGMDGRETCRRILRLAQVPIILLTSLHEDKDVIRGLDCGAVDYVTKPFTLEVLLARARAALRQQALASKPEKPIVYDDGYLTIDLARNQIRVNDNPLKLTKTEHKLLIYLFRNAGQVLSFEQILENVWGPGYQDSIEYIHVYISRLRQKLEANFKKPKYLLTEYGIGYRFHKQSSI